MASHVDVLGTVPIFSMLKPKELEALAKQGHEVTFAAGQQVTGADDMGVTFTVVLDGDLDVVVEGAKVRTLRKGAYFGEMALIDKQPRSATIVATTDSRCLAFTAWTFRPFAMSHPEVAWALLEVMVARVREAEAR